MHLPHKFYKFPFQFDAERMQAEIDALPEDAWQWHPNGFKGNSALPLISTRGEVNDDLDPPMQPTQPLLHCPYIMQVLSTFQTVHGRARLMRIDAGCGVPPHVDLNYYWRSRTRVHIPIVTDPGIRFHCADVDVHMAAGEAWTFDNWLLHKVVNETNTRRVHLTFDTIGGTDFWEMAKPLGQEAAPVPVPFRPGVVAQLAYESYVTPPVMSPSELEIELGKLANDAASNPQNDRDAISRLRAFIANLCSEWRMIWYAKGPTEDGIPVFQSLLEQAQNAMKAIPQTLVMASNGRPVTGGINPVLLAAIRTSAAIVGDDATPVSSVAATGPVASPAIGTGTASTQRPRFEKPVFIVAAPRSGSTMLYETMAMHEGFWTLGGEGHTHVESIAELAPRNRGFASNRLTAEDATAEIRAQLHANYAGSLRDAANRTYAGLQASAPESVRFLEKTPKNALRIPFLKAAYPDAKFIFLHRDAKTNISSIMEAWRSGNFVTYPNLPDWPDLPWSLLLIPGWRELAGRNLEEIALRQWRDTNDIILDDLEKLDHKDWCAVRYEDLDAYRRSTLKRLCAFAGVEFAERMQQVARQPAPLSRYTLTPPSPAKWRKNEAAIQAVLAQTEVTARRLAALEAAAAAR